MGKPKKQTQVYGPINLQQGDKNKQNVERWLPEDGARGNGKLLLKGWKDCFKKKMRMVMQQSRVHFMPLNCTKMMKMVNLT